MPHERKIKDVIPILYMKWWHVAAVALVVLAAIVLWPGTSGPRHVEGNAPVVEGTVELRVLDENGNEINAEVWQKGQYRCAGAEGYLPDCTKKEVIVLRRDPGEEEKEVTLKGCAFAALAPEGVTPVGPVPCGVVRVKAGKYRFALFDGNGNVVGDVNALVKEDIEISAGAGEAKGTATVRFFDGATGDEMNAWLNAKGVALYGREFRIGLEKCETVFGWANGHKLMDAYLCPGREENVYLPRQVNGGTLVVSAPGAERVVITDTKGRVYHVIDGDSASLKDMPPGAYVVNAIDGASVTRRNVDIDTGQKILSIDMEPGYAVIRTEERVQIFALGEKIAEGSGEITVPARTVLHVVVLSDPPEEKVIVLVPGEVRVI